MIRDHSSSTSVLQVYFSQQLVDAEKAYSDLRKKITTKKVYALRVALRRIRTVLQLLRINGIEPLSKGQKKTLKKVWKVLGEQRDADVARKTARTMSIDSAGLKKIREDLKEKTAKVLDHEEIVLVLKTLAQEMEQLTDDKVNPQQVIDKLQSKLHHDFKDTPEDIHKLRILIKKVRYLLAFFGRENETFKSYQDIFGFLNDLGNFHRFGGKQKSIESAWNHQLKICKKAIPEARKLALTELNRLNQRTKRQRP